MKHRTVTSLGRRPVASQHCPSRIDRLESRRLMASLSSGVSSVGIVPGGGVGVDTFQASAGESVLVAFDRNVVGVLWPDVKIFAPDGSLIDARSQTSGIAFDLTELPATGTYRIETRNTWGSTTASADYRVTMAKFPATPGADEGEGIASIQLPSGKRVSGMIDAGDIDVYPIHLQPGRPISIAVEKIGSGSFFGPHVSLWDPTGRLLASDNDFGNGSEIEIASVSTAGTYYVAVRDDDGSGYGGYGVTAVYGHGPIHPDSEFAEPAALQSGTVVHGRFERGDIDAYTLSAHAGDAITISSSPGEGASFVNPKIDLIGPEGRLLASNSSTNGAALQVLAAPLDGVYTVVVRDLETNGEGAYGITATVIGGTQSPDANEATVAIPTGVTNNLTLEPGDIDVFQVTALRGAKLTVTAAEDGGLTINPIVEIFAPDGRRLSYATSIGSTTASRFSVPVSGTYYVQVRPADGSGSGTYTAYISVTGGSDAAAPQLIAANSGYQYDRVSPATLLLGFDEDVHGGFDPQAVQIINLATGQTVAAGPLDVDWLAARSAIEVSLGNGLADGNYRLTVATGGVTDVAGNANATPMSIDFYVLAGDADRDRDVDFDDLLVLAKNYGRTGKTFAYGNFDYSSDGAVNFDDLLVLAKRFNTTLPITDTTPAATSAATAATVRRRSSTAFTIV